VTRLTNNGLIENLKLWLMVEGAAVRSSERIRLLVFSFFLIVFFYRADCFRRALQPGAAVSRPADHGNSAVMPAKEGEEAGSRTHPSEKAVDPLKVDRADPTCKTHPARPDPKPPALPKRKLFSSGL
jgi:hypothetical protein